MMWELVGAVVGAGLASGREIASFFAKYGWLGYAGIAASGFTLYFLGTISHPIKWRFPWAQALWRLLLSAMLIITGGAMLSGAGEVASMILPVKGAYWFGMLMTLLLAWLLANRSITGFAGVCKIMMVALCGMMIAVLFVPQPKSALLPRESFPTALTSGLMYGGFNAALQVPILEKLHLHVEKRRHLGMACVFCSMLLALGNTVMLRQPILISEPLPFLAAVRTWGTSGYCLYAACLYLAILSTLTACMKGIRGPIGLIAFLLVSQIGFTGVVDHLYPVLGTGCFAMLLFAKFAKSSSKPFHSGEDVI